MTRTIALPRIARPRFAWPFGRTVGAVLMVVVALAVLAAGVAAFTFLPSADITITTRTETIGPVELRIEARPDVGAPDASAGVVPARRLTFDVAVSDTFPTSGRRIESSAATGRVTFRSKNPIDPNRIPAGAVVSTPNGIHFETTSAVTIPRATIVGLTVVPGEATVGIEAVEDGPEGNVEARSITVIPDGEDPTFTEVRNDAPTSGGVREEFPRLVQADIDAALEQLGSQLGEEFGTILADPDRVPEGLTLFPDTRVLQDPTPTVDPATLLDQEVAEFELGLTTIGTVIAVDEAPIEGLARTRMTESVEPGFRLVDGSIEVEQREPEIDGEVVVFPVTARAAQIRLLDVEALREEVRGKPVPQARAILEPYGDVDVAVWPDWVTAIPTIDDRVTLRVVPPG